MIFALPKRNFVPLTPKFKPEMKINFGVVGCGYIGKRHADMITANENCRLQALCDIKPKESLGIGAYPAVFHTDYRRMLAEEKGLDVINVCVPNGLHADFAIQAMEHGAHVVIEKPMALRLADADRIVQTSQKTGKKVFCVMQNRYSPPSVWIKELVESGRLGRIEMIQLNCYWNRDERYYVPGSWHGSADMDGGTLFTQFSHFVDILAWLFGDITNIRARFNDFRHQHLTAFEDSGMVQFDLVQGGMGCFNFSTAVYDANLESSLTIVAENGSVKIGGQYMDRVEYCHVKDYQMPVLPPTNPGNDYGAYKGSAQNHHFVIQNVADVLQGKAQRPTSTMEEGRLVVDMIERIYALREESGFKKHI